MAAPPNVELEVAKFLHKLIQDSKDEPSKLAMKLYVICQHMKSSGKEHSMPYQVISRAMETVINQHGLDIEALKSSRLPLAGQNQIGGSSSSQIAGSPQAVAVMRDSQTAMAEKETAQIDAFASSRSPLGPGSAGHDAYQGPPSHRTSHRSSRSYDHENPSSLETRSANSQSQDRIENASQDKQGNKKASGKRKRADSSSGMEQHIDSPQQFDSRSGAINPRMGMPS
ncbi:hypothetical protein RJ641_021141 [Dillenia turbinata]|uniref:Uncharacterized protein n=1 Tax=Dillenia turbinata TaxID=194707 RepID=A0AAN8UE81_9MAGN